MAKQCADCRDGDHENLSDEVELVTVKDPETGKLVKRSYMCTEHVDCYLSDGYNLYFSDGTKVTGAKLPRR